MFDLNKISFNLKIKRKMSVIATLFQHQLTVKMYHFQTKRYGAHKAADAYLVKYGLNLDQFMEVWQGETETVKDTDLVINVKTYNDSNIAQHLNSVVVFLNSFLLSTELKAIRDTMLADLQQFKYLLTFE